MILLFHFDWTYIEFSEKRNIWQLRPRYRGDCGASTVQKTSSLRRLQNDHKIMFIGTIHIIFNPVFTHQARLLCEILVLKKFFLTCKGYKYKWMKDVYFFNGFCSRINLLRKLNSDIPFITGLLESRSCGAKKNYSSFFWSSNTLFTCWCRRINV